MVFSFLNLDLNEYETSNTENLNKKVEEKGLNNPEYEFSEKNLQSEKDKGFNMFLMKGYPV